MRIARVGRAALVAAMSVGSAAAPAHAADLLPLRVEHGSNPALVDGGDREVLLRGVNVNGLVDYEPWDPAQPTVIGLARGDLSEIAALGFNSIRLAISWSALEPQRGVFADAYVARIREAVGWARDAGLYVVLDMHQDAWGRHVRTPPGTACEPGLEPAIGWDGAPAWATLTDGQSTCRAAGTRELSAAVAQAFTNLYDNREDIQAHFALAWRRLAAEFATEPAIAAFDLLNEPHPGFRVGADSSFALGRFYARAIAAIRDGESSVPRSLRHPIVFEPSVAWSGAGTDAIPPAGFTTDDQLVFSPHMYAESITLDQRSGATATSIEQGWHNARGAAAAYNAPLWPGEWGWFGDPADDLPKVIRYARQEDRSLAGGAWWVWKQACGDPHAAGAQRSVSLHPLACPGDRPLGRTDAFVRVITRAYPRAVPNRLTRLESDPATGRFALSGADTRGARRCQVQIWIPGAGHPSVKASGISELAVRRSGHGWLATGCARAWYSLEGTAGAGAPATQPSTPATGDTEPAPARPSGCRGRHVAKLTLPRGLRRVRVRVIGASARVRRRGRRVRLAFTGARPAQVVVVVTARHRSGRRYTERRPIAACNAPRE